MSGRGRHAMLPNKRNEVADSFTPLYKMAYSLWSLM